MVYDLKAMAQELKIDLDAFIHADQDSIQAPSGDEDEPA